MSRFAEFSVPNGDRDLQDDDELINNVPVEIEESKSVLLDKEDSKNLVVKVIATNQQKGKRIKVDTMPIPRAFDLDYYQQKIDNANFNHDRDAAVKALAIKRYADIAYEFYRNVMYVFNKKNDIIMMPDYIKMCEKVPCDVDNLANTMYTREQDLIKAFGGSDNIISGFSKVKHLTELKQFSAQAWMMYFNLKSLNDFIGYLKYIQNCKNKANLNNNSHVANLYGLHVQTGYYLDANITNFFAVYKNGLLKRKCPNSANMYRDLNSMDEFNLLLKEKDAYVYSENHDEIVDAAKSVLRTEEEGSVNKRIIGFYNHYRDMKYIKHKLKHIYNDNKDKDFEFNTCMFEDQFNVNEKYRNRDVYIVGLKYYAACKDMVENLPIKSKIYKDICDMCAELEEILLNNQDKYKLWKNELKKAEKEFQERNPELAEKLKNEKPQNETISSI